MNKLTVIVLTVLLMTGIKSMASDQGLQDSSGDLERSELVFSNETNVLLLHDDQVPCSTPPRPVEEESEDDDDTTKEKVLQKTLTMNHCLTLRQLFSLQYQIFKDHHQEIATPPPKI